MARGRLEIVLDLDHTLLHAHGPRPSLESESANGRRLHSFLLRGDDPRGETHYLLGLRDGVHEFIEQLTLLGTVHVYTMGAKAYAGQVMDIIDPKQLVEGRVLCRKDDHHGQIIKSLDHVFVDEQQRVDVQRCRRALVLDDRADVWDPKWRDQLIQVPPFRCRPCPTKWLSWTTTNFVISVVLVT